MWFLVAAVVIAWLVVALAISAEVSHWLAESRRRQALTEEELAEKFRTYGNVEVRE